MEVHADLSQQREVLLRACLEKDVEDIHEMCDTSGKNVAESAAKKMKSALVGTNDKSALVNIICTRTRWQLKDIAEMYEEKYEVKLLDTVNAALSTLVSSFMTGSGQGLNKLIKYKLSDQPTRDATLLREFSDGITLDDENLWEILCTRSNEELKAAIDIHLDLFGKHFPDIVKGKCSYKNYREFMQKVLKCERNELLLPFDEDDAEKLANEVLKAGAERAIGVNPEPFIRIFSVINKPKFDSINRCYPEERLVDDIKKKLGGDFAMAVLTMCSDKYEFLAGRIDTSLRAYSPDKEMLCRVLGCLSRSECQKIREAYDKAHSEKKDGPILGTLEKAIKMIIKQEKYREACLLLIDPDPATTPLGSSRELGEDELEALKEGIRAREMAELNYRQQTMIKLGEMKMKQDGYVNPYDQDIPKFKWDEKWGKDMSGTMLVSKLRDCETGINMAKILKERLIDEVSGFRDVLYSIMKHSYETETWIRIYRGHVKYLLAYEEKRGMKTDVKSKLAQDKLAAVAKQAAKQKKIEDDAKKAAMAWKAKSKVGGSSQNLAGENSRDKTPPPPERLTQPKDKMHPGSPDALPQPPLSSDETTVSVATKKKAAGASGATAAEETNVTPNISKTNKSKVEKDDSKTPEPTASVDVKALKNKGGSSSAKEEPSDAPAPSPAAAKPSIDLKALKNKGGSAPPAKKQPAKPKFTQDIEPASDDEDVKF